MDSYFSKVSQKNCIFINELQEVVTMLNAAPRVESLNREVEILTDSM